MISSMHETWVLSGSCRAIFLLFARVFATTIARQHAKTGGYFSDDLKSVRNLGAERPDS